MDRLTGRPDHIMDYLTRLREGDWYGFSDKNNQVYSTLIVHDGGYKPTETECNDGLKALQDAWDERNKEYKRQRIVGVGTTAGYESIANQLDQLYHDMQDGKLGVAATTGSWFVGITSVKTAIAKT
tara:strand:- start:45 stop:422 length:378 start_codon:yes stop_codon:yes gene_type:complete